MKVIAGSLGGRTVYAPKTSGTRPMTDKARGALFDILGPLDGYVVLDAYAGSGALGIEAISRGAERVVAIEAGREAQVAIHKNVKELNIQWQYQLYPMKVESWRQSITDIMSQP